MNKRKSGKVWTYVPQVPKYTVSEKEKILEKVKVAIKERPKLSKKVSRLDMRANRIYLYELVEQFNPEGTVYMKPLIENKYLEFPYARITLNDRAGNRCNVDWQRHNNQWMTLHSGTLTECLDGIENDNDWF